VEDAIPRPSYVRIGFWTLWVAAFAAAAYAARGTHTTEPDVVYKFSTFVFGTVFYAVWLGFVLLVTYNRLDLLALRRPQSWRNAAGYAGAAIAAIIACEFVVSLLPLPQSPGQEQGIAPTQWQSAHAAAFAANFVLLAVIAPFVEELMYRGLGQSLFRFLGQYPAMLIVGVAFGVNHGLVEGLLVLIPFGIALAWVRERTDSVVPGMLVHGIFNGGTLLLAVALA